MFERLFWRPLARFLARPAMANRLIDYAMRTPYFHLPSDDDPSYMARYWVFNPYNRETNVPRWAPLIPFSIRVHHIKRADNERHLHDHPWNARTIILRGWYVEQRHTERDWELFELVGGWPGGSERFIRTRGETARLGFEEYHRIIQVNPGGVWTLFISWRWRGAWGFLVDGAKVPWRDYLGIK